MSETNDRTEEICPNCLDPIPAGMDVCPSCGTRLNEDPDAVQAEPVEGTIVTQPNETAGPETAGAANGDGKDGEKKPTMMQNLIRGMGVYLIYTALTNGYRVISTPEALGLERGTREYTLGIVSNVVYLVAGILAVWPWIQEAIAKRKAAASDITIDAIPAETSETELDAPKDEPTLDEENAEAENPDTNEFAELRAKADAALREESESDA